MHDYGLKNKSNLGIFFPENSNTCGGGFKAWIWEIQTKAFIKGKQKFTFTSQDTQTAILQREIIFQAGSDWKTGSLKAATAKTAHESSHLGEPTWSKFIHLETTEMLRF